jgi:hypothetical protein
VVTSSGIVGAHAAKACNTSSIAGAAKIMAPPKNRGTGTRSNSSAETIPKLP